MVLRSVEIVVNGVKMVVSVLVPGRPAMMDDVAEQIVAEDDGLDAVRASEASREARAARAAHMSEPERIRQAASRLKSGRDVSDIPRHLLDPSAPAEAQILTWLGTLSATQVGLLALSSDADISAHLDGVARLPMPLLGPAEEKAEEARAALRPLDAVQWARFLASFYSSRNPDADIDVDELLDEAEDLAERHATIADFRFPDERAPDDHAGVMDDLTDDDWQSSLEDAA